MYECDHAEDLTEDLSEVARMLGAGLGGPPSRQIREQFGISYFYKHTRIFYPNIQRGTIVPSPGYEVRCAYPYVNTEYIAGYASMAPCTQTHLSGHANRTRGAPSLL